MMPDPNRQWFVYFKDKEMGPFSEADLSAKLKSGEVDNSAYVFTEGMSDWALVSDTEVFAPKGPAVAPAPEPVAPVAKAEVSAPAKEPAATAAQPVKDPQLASVKAQVKTAEPTVQTAAPAAAAASAKIKIRPRWVRPVLYSALVLAVLCVGVGWWVDQGGYVPGLSEFVEGPNRMPPPSPLPQNAVSGGVAVAPPGTGTAIQTPKPLQRGFDWNELREFRKSNDPKGPPFRISTRTLGEAHPVIVGVLSPLVQAKKVRIAVYPDNEKSLMPVSKIWFIDANVLDGYFSAGPLNVEGAELPPGRYHLMAAANGSFLGEVTFESGSWPSQDKVAEIQSQLQKDRALMAEKERTALEMKLRETAAAIEQLKQLSPAAGQGLKGAAKWVRVAKPWRDSMIKALDEQRLIMSGPMFYPEAQKKLFDLMSEAVSAQEGLDALSQGGAKALLKVKKKTIGQLWADLGSQQSNVTGEIQILGQAAVGPLKLDPEVVKAQVVEGSK